MSASLERIQQITRLLSRNAGLSYSEVMVATSTYTSHVLDTSLRASVYRSTHDHHYNGYIYDRKCLASALSYNFRPICERTDKERANKSMYHRYETPNREVNVMNTLANGLISRLKGVSNEERLRTIVSRISVGIDAKDTLSYYIIGSDTFDWEIAAFLLSHTTYNSVMSKINTMRTLHGIEDMKWDRAVPDPIT